MTSVADDASGRAKKRRSARAVREARAAQRQVVFEALAAGWSVEQIAELRKVSPRTVRREVDRTLAERRLDAPDRYAHLQVARLTKALRLADAAIDDGNLKAIGPLVKVVRSLDRYHGLEGSAGAPSPPAIAPPLPAPSLPAPPLRLTRSAPRMIEQVLAESIAVTISQEIPSGARAPRAMPHSEAALAAGESDFVTGLGAEAAEIAGPAPEARRGFVEQNDAEPVRGDDASSSVAPEGSGADGSEPMTGLDSQYTEIVQPAPELHDVAVWRGEPREPEAKTPTELAVAVSAEPQIAVAAATASSGPWGERPRFAIPIVGSAS